MKRKVVKQGAATLMISLPSKWAKENSIEKGTEINIDQTGNDLLISANESTRKSETAINLVNIAESSIRTLITNTYRKGCDKIKVIYSNEKQFEILDNTIKTKLIGFEIVKKTKDHCLVENVTEPSGDQFDNIINKFFLNIDSLFSSTLARLENKQPEEDYNEIEERILKYDNFCRRTIAKRKLNISKSEFLWSFIATIDHAQREIYHLNKALDKLNIKVSEETINLILEARNIFNIIKEVYLDKNIDKLAKLHEKEKELIYKKGYSLLEKKQREAVIVYHILASIRNFYQANSPLSGIII